MKGTLKWLLMLILRLLQTEQTIDLVVKLLAILAQRTDNKIDDGLVRIVAELVYDAFGLKTEEKLAQLDELFAE